MSITKDILILCENSTLESLGWKKQESGEYKHPHYPGHKMMVNDRGVWHYFPVGHKRYKNVGHQFVSHDKLSNYLQQDVHGKKENITNAHGLLTEHGWERTYHREGEESRYSHSKHKDHFLTVKPGVIHHEGLNGHKYNSLYHSQLKDYMDQFHGKKEVEL